MQVPNTHFDDHRLATALDFELKVVDPLRLITFCRNQDGGFCIPIETR